MTCEYFKDSFNLTRDKVSTLVLCVKNIVKLYLSNDSIWTGLFKSIKMSASPLRRQNILNTLGKMEKRGF